MNQFGLQWEGQIVDGRIKLGAYLGGSENACVYATQVEGKPAAIKLIRADRAQAKDHLLRWSRATRISHPSIAQMFENGRCRIGDTDLVYAVMERADETLAEILPQRALTPKEVRDMLSPILDALAYLHERRFAHSRMKPANILAIGDHVKLSSDGIGVFGALQNGSSNYDAPEMASTGASAAGDVWSLGMVLVQALTQELPRWSPSSQEGPIVPALIPQPFFESARNCLRRDPQQRWTVADVSARLQGLAAPRRADSPEAAIAAEEAAPQTRPAIRPGLFQPALEKSAAQRMQPRRSLRLGQLVPAIVLIALAVVVVLVATRISDRWQKHPGRVVEAGPTLTPSVSPEGSQAAEPEETPEKTPAPANEAAPATGSSPGNSEGGVSSSSAGANESAPARAPAAAPAEKMPAEVSQDQIVERVMPKVPQSALDTITGTVKVGIRVQVAPSGAVNSASIDSRGPSAYFAKKAVEAANGWKFAPAAARNGNDQRELTLKFEFRRDGTKVIPTALGQ